MPNPMTKAVKNIGTQLLKPAKKLEKLAQEHTSMFFCISQPMPILAMHIIEALTIKFNKNISDDQKNFLVPQALSECFIKVGVILGLSTLLNKLASCIFKAGIFRPKSIFVANENDSKKYSWQKLPPILKKSSNMKELLKAKTPELIPESIASKLGSNKKNIYNSLKKTEGGFKVLIASIIGIFTANHIIAPFVTNTFAKWYRAKYTPVKKKINNNSSFQVNTQFLQNKTFNKFSKTSLGNQNIFFSRNNYSPTSLKL